MSSGRFWAVAGFAVSFGAIHLPAQTIDLPSSKELIGEVPGHPQRLNSLPISMAVSPDGRYVVTVNAGYGTYESQYDESFAVLDTQTGALTDFPDSRTGPRARQTLYSGLAFSRDGSHHVCEHGFAHRSGRERAAGDTGSGIAVYRFEDGKIAPERMIQLPMVQLPNGRTTRLPAGKDES